jgi:hypothetical protein
MELSHRDLIALIKRLTGLSDNKINDLRKEIHFSTV